MELISLGVFFRFVLYQDIHQRAVLLTERVYCSFMMVCDCDTYIVTPTLLLFLLAVTLGRDTLARETLNLSVGFVFKNKRHINKRLESGVRPPMKVLFSYRSTNSSKAKERTNFSVTE